MEAGNNNTPPIVETPNKASTLKQKSWEWIPFLLGASALIVASMLLKYSFPQFSSPLDWSQPIFTWSWIYVFSLPLFLILWLLPAYKRDLSVAPNKVRFILLSLIFYAIGMILAPIIFSIVLGIIGGIWFFATLIIDPSMWKGFG